MAWKAWLCLVLTSRSIRTLFAFDMYPWGKYDFKEYSDDLLDGLRENVHLKVWESTLSDSLPTSSNSLLLKNSEGNTYELKLKQVPVGNGLALAPIQSNDFAAISEALKTSCALHADGYWSYEWCHTKEVRQFHLEQRGNALHREPDWSLGKESRMVTIREKHVGDTTAEAKTRRITKIIEYFENGQRCDETGEGRATEVHIVCCEGTAVKNYISAASYYASVDGTAPHGLKLPAGTIASITEPDLCTYEVTVCSPLMCKRPSDVLSTASTTPVAFQDASSTQLSSVMKFINGTCLSKQEDWWTYELCFHSGLRQVHYEIQQVIVNKKVTQKQQLLSQYQLGIAPVELYDDEQAVKKSVSGPDRAARSTSEKAIIRRAGMVTPAFRMRGREPNYLRFEFVDGTPCDLDAVNRSAMVDVYCGNKNRLVGIWEDRTCHYHVQVELSALCGFSDFLPYKENTTTVEFIPYETDSNESVEDKLTAALFAVEVQEYSESEPLVEQSTSMEGFSVHDENAVPIVEELTDSGKIENEIIEEVSQSKQGILLSDARGESVHTDGMHVEATENEVHFVGEEEWGKSDSSLEEAIEAGEKETSPLNSNNNEVEHDITGTAVNQHVENENHHQDHHQPSDQEELQATNTGDITPENDLVEQEIVQEEIVSSAEVLNLVMQLEHAAAELDMPLNLSRSALMELIESAIAQAVEEDKEGKGEAEKASEGAPTVVLKYAFIADDGEEAVVLGAGEAHTGDILVEDLDTDVETEEIADESTEGNEKKPNQEEDVPEQSFTE